MDQQFALQWVQNNVRIHKTVYLSMLVSLARYRYTSSMVTQLVLRSGASPQVCESNEGLDGLAAYFFLDIGAGSVIQHVVANGGKTSPPLFRAAITSSTFLPSQYRYDDRIPEVC